MTAEQVSGGDNRRGHRRGQGSRLGLAFETLATGAVSALDWSGVAVASRQSPVASRSVTHRMVLRECIPWAEPDAMATMSNEQGDDETMRDGTRIRCTRVVTATATVTSASATRHSLRNTLSPVTVTVHRCCCCYSLFIHWPSLSLCSLSIPGPAMDAIRVAKVDNVVLERPIPPSTKDGVPTRSRQTGTLHLTPHHLIFDTTSTSSETASEIWIPYPTITLLTRLPQSIAGLYPLQIRTRTFGSYVLLFDKDRQGGAEDVWQSVKDCAVASE